MLRIAGILWLLASTALAQNVIELKSSARIAPGSAVTLRDVATLQGPDTVAIAETPIPASGGAVGIDDVHKALEGKVNWGRVSLRGSSCAILTAAAPREAAAPKPTPSAPGPIEPGTIREGIQTRLAQILKADPADLRLTFDAADSQFLETPTAGRTLDVRAVATADRIPLSVTLYDGDHLIREKSIRVAVKVRRDVHVALAPRRRGETLETGDHRPESQWLPPTVRPASLDQIEGSAARGRINPGDVIEVDDVSAATVVSKGDVVIVRCISGGVIVSTKARAVGPARDGDLVEFEALDSKRHFFARMEGRGRAIVAAAPEEAR